MMGAYPCVMCADGFRTAHGAAGVGRRNVGGLPVVTPRIGSGVSALSGELPLPLVRKALAGPCRIGAGVF